MKYSDRYYLALTNDITDNKMLVSAPFRFRAQFSRVITAFIILE